MDAVGGKAFRFCWLAITALAAQIPSSVLAQVITDGTTGSAGLVAGPDYQITEDLGTRAGDNLFHSFSDFSIGTGESATFSGPDEIENVISRVTGPNPSDIDGTLRSTMPAADFYFINPNGVTFGPNATLDVQGSFHVSTADELRFEGGNVFSATDPGASGLSVAEPRAFGFFDADPGAILVDGPTLEVDEGETLSLVGGDITVDGGRLNAEAGTINLLALGGLGEADVASGDIVVEKKANIMMANQAVVETSGDGGGATKVRGRSLFVIIGSSIVADNIGPTDRQNDIDVSVDVLGLGIGSTILSRTLGSSNDQDHGIRISG